MKIYLEAREKTPFGVEPEFIRADITEKGSAEVYEIEEDIKAIMVGRSYRLIKHTCHHDTGGSCQSELIKEV